VGRGRGGGRPHLTIGSDAANLPGASESADVTRERDPGARWAALAFAVVALGAFAFYISLGRRQWFFADEWEFLSSRSIGGGDLLRAHYGHWVAVPIVAYRFLWQVVGLRSYVPYVGLSIALHLVAAGLLWVVMRRAHVRPWTATIVASVFVLFGAGAQDILWAFQITFTGALVFGLAHLLLADHDGPTDSRDWLGLGAGLLGLMCSGVAVTMVIVVGIATLLRRGWRAAALNTVPLGVIYAAWWLRYSHGTSPLRGSTREIFDWVVSGAGGVFGELGSVRGTGWLLAALLIGGGVLVARRSGIGDVRKDLVLPVALLIGAAVFLLIAGFDRGGVGSAAARQSRYLHILAALVLPAIAVAIDAVLDRSRVLGVVAIAVLLVGVPGNVASARDYSHRQRRIDGPTRQMMLSIGRDPLASNVPAALRPEPNRAPTLTLGWLRSGIASGRVPSTRPPSAFEARTNRLRLSLMELDERSRYGCTALTGPSVVRLARGERLGVGGKVAVVLLDSSAGGHPLASGVVLFGNGLLNQSLSHTLVAVRGPLTLRIAPNGRLPTALCRQPRT